MKNINSVKEFQEILKLHEIIIIDIYGTWCPPCKIIGPYFEKLASDFPNVYAAKVNVDEAEDLVKDFQISAVPTFFKFVRGKKVDSAYGVDKQKLLEMFQN